MLRIYTKFLDIVELVEKAILAITFPVMVIVMTYQVVLRYVFNNSNAWSEELTRYLFIANVMVASAIAIRRNSHLQIDVIIGLLKPKVKAIFTIGATVVGIVFLALLFVYSLELCTEATGNLSPGTGVSMAVPYAAIPIGCILMILTSIEVILKNIEFVRNGEEVVE